MVATAKDLGLASAQVEAGATATVEASGSGSVAEAKVVEGVGKALASDVAVAGVEVTAARKVTANASGLGGGAGASCEHAGSAVTTEATRGSTAIGSDTAGPVCMPKNGGIAKVISPMGNCRPM